MTRHSHTAAKEPSPTTFEGANAAAAQRTFPWHLSAAAWCVALLTLAAAILRISFLGSKSLWFDEGATASVVALPFSSLLKFLMHHQMNMFLYYLLLHGWTLIAGSSEFMLRLPSALFGVATISLVYVLGAELGHRRAGLVAALMLTVNTTSIEYAQSARSYSMYVALATLASIAFVRSVKRGSVVSFVSYIGSGTFSVYTHLFAIWALPSQWLSLFLFRPDRKKAIGVTICMLTISVLSVPAFIFAISGDHGNVAWVSRTSLHSLMELFFTFAGKFDGRTTTLMTVLTVLLTMLYLIGVVSAVVWRQRDDSPALGYLLLSICLPVVLTAVISFVKPLFVPRYLLAGLPLFALLAAIGFQRLRPAFAIAMVFAISILSLAQDYSYYRAPSIEDWRGMVDYLAKHSRPGDALLIFPAWETAPVDYYVSRRDHPGTFPTRVFQLPVEGSRKSIENPERLLAKSGAGRVWVTSSIAVDETGIKLIFSNERVVDEPTFYGVRLFLLERNP